MKQVITRYGLYGVVVMILLAGTTFMIFHKDPNWEVQEVLGYATIILSLMFVYFGIRRWRDAHNGGQLSFWKGIGLGSAITLFPSVAFGLLSWIELKIDPEFFNKYYSYYIEKAKRETPPDQIEAVLKKMAEEREMFSSPFAQFFFMFLTVFMIGFIITIISTLILKRKEGSRMAEGG